MEIEFSLPIIQCRETAEGVCDALDLLDSLETIQLDQLDVQLAQECNDDQETSIPQEPEEQSTAETISKDDNGILTPLMRLITPHL